MKKLLTTVAALAAVLSIAGCASSGGGASGDEGVTTADFDMKALVVYDFETPIEDSDVIDASGNERYGLAGGDGTLVEGKYGQAMVFNGSDGYIMVPEDTLDAAAWTFAAWVKPDSWRDWSRIMDFGDGNLADIWLGFAGIEKRTRLDIFSSGKAVTLLAPTLVPGEWSHIAFTFGDGKVVLYVNGKAAQEVPLDLKPTDIVKKGCYIGRSNWSADPLFTGAMDEILIADAVYTPAQIKAVMKGIVRN